MSWITSLQRFTNDTARQVQFFMLCRQLGVILSSVVLAWYLPVDEVGTMELLFFTGYLMTFFWSDALLRGFLASKAVQEDPVRITSFYTLFFLASVIFMLVLIGGQQLLVPLITARKDLEGLELFALYQVLIAPFWIAPFAGLLKGQNILLASLFVLVGPAFACWTGATSLPGISGILLGLFCYALVGFVWILTQSKFLNRVQLLPIFRLIWPATWPLVLYALSNGLARSFDAWLVARHFDEVTFAIFRYGAREFPLVVALSAGFSTIMIPRLFDNLSLGELKERSTRIMHSCYPIVGLLMMASPLLFVNIFGSAYRNSAEIFNIYLLITLTQLVFPQTILIARGQTKLLWYVSIVELIVNVIASLFLMQFFGIAGIALGTLVAFAFEKIMLLLIIRRKFGIEVASIIQIPVWFIYSTLIVLLYFLSKWVSGI